jgi:hypothetical protein
MKKQNKEKATALTRKHDEKVIELKYTALHTEKVDHNYDENVDNANGAAKVDHGTQKPKVNDNHDEKVIERKNTAALTEKVDHIYHENVDNANGAAKVDHGTSKPLSSFYFFDMVWQYSQNDEYNENWIQRLSVQYDELKTGMAIILRAIPILNCLVDPAVRTLPLTKKWLSSMVFRGACRDSEISAVFPGTPLDLKNLRRYDCNSWVGEEGPFNPGKVLRSSTVRCLSQKKFFGIGEELVLQHKDSCSDDARSVIVTDYKEDGTENHDDVESILTNVVVCFMWKCNQKHDMLAANDVLKYFKVYRTERREGSLSRFHNNAKDTEYVSTYINRATESKGERTQQVEEKDNTKKTQKVEDNPPPRNKRASFCNAAAKMHCWTSAKGFDPAISVEMLSNNQKC